MASVRKKDGESVGSLIYRFTKKIQQSGILREARKRRFHDRAPNSTKKRLAAIYREKRSKEIKEEKKQGLF